MGVRIKKKSDKPLRSRAYPTEICGGGVFKLLIRIAYNGLRQGGESSVLLFPMLNIVENRSSHP